MRIIWVSTLGNDTTGTGLQDAPYATLDRAVLDFESGDQIRILDGTYTPEDTLSFEGMSGSIFSENPNEVTIQPEKTTTNSACISITNAARFSVIGVNITQASESPDSNSVGVYARNVDALLVETCDIYGFTADAGSLRGIYADGGGRLENCSIYSLSSCGDQIIGVQSIGVDVVDCAVFSLSGVNNCSVIGIDARAGL